MSSEALAWAFKQEIKPSSVKFTLVALCECANYRTGLIFPSISHLSEITGQDRKTVIANIAELERRGLIADTGERSGKTKQVKVYSAAVGTVPETEQYQKRNSTGNEPKQYRKRDTEPSREPSTSEAKASSVKRATPKFELPDRIPADPWAGWLEMRKRIGKPATDRAKELAVKELDRLADGGWPPGDVLNHCTMNSYQGIFPPKDRANGSRTNPTNDRGSPAQALHAARHRLGFS